MTEPTTAEPETLVHAAPPRRRRFAGALGAVIILFGTFGLWLFAACAELFWYDQHGSRLVIVALASLPASAALIWVMSRRLRPTDGLSRWALVLIATAGGFVALIIPSLTEPPWERWVESLDLPALAPVIAGPLEETVKLAVVVIVARWLTVRTARSGLFVGGAVGAGYAVFENIDFAWNAANRGGSAFSPEQHLATMVRVAIERNVFDPFAHPLWTALAAAALFAGMRGGRIRITPLAVGGWAVAVILHSLWDDLPDFFETPLVNSPFLAFVAVFGWGVLLSVVGFVIWLFVARRANRVDVVVPAEVTIPA